jgi:hypothetical protein
MSSLKSYIILTLILLSTISNAQLAPDVYWIQFTDKNNTPYRIDEPESYLSERSIERRIRYNIEIDSLDLPVNSWFLDSIKLKGASIIHVSKWMNAAAIYTDNTDVLQAIYDLDFVDEFASTKPSYSMLFAPFNSQSNLCKINTDVYDYGEAKNQINLHKGEELHNRGLLGQNMYIAVIDAGFEDLDQVPAFDSIFINHQIIGTWDFVNNDTNVYDDHYHGKSVLSTIAANLPGEMIGTAPKAHFLLLRSENVVTEYKIEEFNWIVAAEYADSIGVDIITTSLGYNNYSSPSTSYTWEDLNGETAPISIATNIAASKGIFMISSAGNEGSNSWEKITSPADAQKTLTVGACDENGEYASFSSRGYTADRRIKPDICAMGKSTSIIVSDEVTTGNGTSFSAPIIAGLVACFWQADLSKSNSEIADLIKQHSSQYLAPDSIMGYGIPDFYAAYNDLTNSNKITNSNQNILIKVFPTVFNRQIFLQYYSTKQNQIKVEIINSNGILVYTQEFLVDSNRINIINIPHLPMLASGIYFLRLTDNNYASVKKIIKQ